ncbi:MAG TPA: response regulator [Thermoanaerobaculia bacterium]|nr:response regulator [Thermoanaerobaculia bacterium]
MISPQETRILVVEDNPLDRKLLNVHLTSRGYEPKLAADGVEAWEMLESDPESVDVVLLDRSMPRMGGIELLGRMKKHTRLRMVPVILQTSSIATEDIVEGLQAGAYYYFTKPYDPDMLVAVVRTAVTDYAELRELQDQLRKGLKSLRLLREAVFSLQTVEQARDIAGIMANTCPDPPAAVIGLTELLLNAIEHGNLGITYDEKSVMTSKEEWHAEIARRLALPENAKKRVEMRYECDEKEIRFTIRDAGSGFDWRRFFEIGPERVFHAHGRGIIMARALSFTSVEYRDPGNEVLALITL